MNEEINYIKFFKTEKNFDIYFFFINKNKNNLKKRISNNYFLKYIFQK